MCFHIFFTDRLGEFCILSKGDCCERPIFICFKAVNFVTVTEIDKFDGNKIIN